jgi:hypothetical protein
MLWHTRRNHFRLSPKRTSPFKWAGVSFQSIAGSRGVRISGNNAGYTMFRDSVRVLATHSIRQFPFHFPFRASPCAIRFQTHATSVSNTWPVKHVNFLQTKKERNYILYHHLLEETVTCQKTMEIGRSNS